MNEIQQGIIRGLSSLFIPTVSSDEPAMFLETLMGIGYYFRHSFHTVEKLSFLEQMDLHNCTHVAGEFQHLGRDLSSRKYIRQYYVHEDGDYIIFLDAIDKATPANPTSYPSVRVFSKKRDVPFEFKTITSTEQKIQVKFTVGGSIFTSTYKPVFKEIDLDLHYNEHIYEVHEHMLDFLQSNKSGITILQGPTGTGKTNYILWLTTLFPRYNFVFIDASAATTFNLALEISKQYRFFDENDDKTIYVFEDCEALLKKRETNVHGEQISSFLGAIDGVIGKAFPVKAIFTSNLLMADIDDAILRPGRTYGIYAFDKLTEDRVKKINPELSGRHTLAEIYNEKHEEELSVTKIGF